MLSQGGFPHHRFSGVLFRDINWHLEAPYKHNTVELNRKQDWFFFLSAFSNVCTSSRVRAGWLHTTIVWYAPSPLPEKQTWSATSNVTSTKARPKRAIRALQMHRLRNRVRRLSQTVLPFLRASVKVQYKKQIVHCSVFFLFLSVPGQAYEIMKELGTNVQLMPNHSTPMKTDTYFNRKMKTNRSVTHTSFLLYSNDCFQFSTELVFHIMWGFSLFGRQLVFCSLAVLAEERSPLECLDAFGATGETHCLDSMCKCDL